MVRRTFEALPDDVEKRNEALAEFQRESRRREDEIAALERRLKTSEPKYAILFAAERKWTPEELAGLLANDEVLLYFNVIGKQVAVFVGRHGKGFDLQVLDAGAEDLQAKVNALLVDMRPRNGKLTAVSDLKGRLGGLRADLLRGLEEKLEGARALLVIPDGFLHLFPFEALVLDEWKLPCGEARGPLCPFHSGAPRTRATGMRRRRTRSSSSSATRTSGSRRRTRRGPRSRSASRGGRGFRKLEHAREEVDRIAGLFQEKVVLRGARRPRPDSRRYLHGGRCSMWSRTGRTNRLAMETPSSTRGSPSPV